MSETGKAKEVWKSLCWHILAAASLFVVDSVVYHQRTLAIVTLAVVVVWFTTRAALRSQTEGAGGITILRPLVYLIMVGCTLVAFGVNEHVAERNADRVIGALNHFRNSHGRYPDSLEELVPLYMKAIPWVNLTLTSDRFEYAKWGCAGSPRLMYRAYRPGAVIRFFCFSTDTWHQHLIGD